MDIGTMQGALAVVIGITLFIMGFVKGERRGAKFAINHLFEIGILTVDETGNIKAGPVLNK